jgi:hypothetical protein
VNITWLYLSKNWWEKMHQLRTRCSKLVVIGIQVCKRSWEEESIGGKTSLIGEKNNKNNVQWTMDLKWCEEVGDALQSTIKANLPLVATTYHAPFCKLTLPICMYNMQLTIAKHKAWQDGQDASHMALIESSCIYQGFTTSFLINRST